MTDTDMEWIDEILGMNWMALPPEKRPKDYVEGTYTWQRNAIRAHLIAEMRGLLESVKQKKLWITVPNSKVKNWEVVELSVIQSALDNLGK